MLPPNKRRRFLAASTVSLALAVSPTIFGQASCDLKDNVRRPKWRFALIITNGQYPNSRDTLPTAKRQGEQLAQVLSSDFGFTVKVAHDQNLAATQAALNAFFAEVARTLASPGVEPGDVASIVYFCGHGIQLGGKNLLVPANTDQRDPRIEDKSLVLQRDILAKLPSLPGSYPGLNLVFIDACRTEGSVKDPFAQFSSVQGAIVCIGSSAGNFAFFPNEQGVERDPTSMSFFCEAILGELKAESANPLSRTSMEEFVTNVERRTADVSLKRGITEINEQRKLLGLPPYPAQLPESTKNLREPGFVWNSSVVACHAQTGADYATRLARQKQQEPRFQEIQAEIYPRRLIGLCDAFLKDFPSSDYESSVKAKRADADKTSLALRASQLSADAIVNPDVGGDSLYREYLRKASSKGDKDAAQLVAWMYRDGSNGLGKNPLRHRSFLRLAAELNNGIAAYELFELLRRDGSPDTRKYLERARTLGYPVPRDLPDIR